MAQWSQHAASLYTIATDLMVAPTHSVFSAVVQTESETSMDAARAQRLSSTPSEATMVVGSVSSDRDGRSRGAMFSD